MIHRFSSKMAMNYISSRTRNLVQHGKKLLSTVTADEISLDEMMRSIVPPLDSSNYKGQCGKVAIIGGSKEFSGAPYFAGITALRVGCDLVHVFCVKEAGTSIKSFSPDLIVHPILDGAGGVDQISELLPKMHSVIVGPGLGRDPAIFSIVETIIERAKAVNLPILLDADGVHIVSLNPDIIKGYKAAILTPNIAEFKRLYKDVMGQDATGNDPQDEAVALSRALGQVTIVRKGPEDIITDATNVIHCRKEGSARRCGGQGDMLSGSIGVFAYWANKTKINNNNVMYQNYGANMTAAYAGCVFTRTCSKLAFRKHGRSMVTQDMTLEIHSAFEGLFS